MKKIVWVLVGGAVVIGLGILISRERSQEPQKLTTEYTENTEGFGTTKHTKGESDKSVQSVEDPRDFGVDDSSLDASGQTGTSAPLDISDAVKALVGLDGKKHNYPSLLAAINKLDYEISAVDVAALMEMLNFPNDRFPEKMRSIEVNAVKNDVLDKLLRQKELPKGLGLQMVEMADNPENDPVWRDYCTQFLPVAWERIDAEYRISNKEQGISKDGDAGSFGFR